MFKLNRRVNTLRHVLQAPPVPQQFLKLSLEELKQQFDKTSDIINSIVALLIGFCFYSALALSSLPDTRLLSTTPTTPELQVPFVQGRISFLVFLLIGPLTLLLLSLYVHIYVEHWWGLLRLQIQRAADAGLQPPLLLHPPLFFNLPYKIASVTSVFVLYLLVPLILLFFCYEALKLPQTPSKRYGLIGFLTSLIKGGPLHSLSPVSFAIPLTSIAIVSSVFLLGRRVIEPNAQDWKRTASAYRYSFALIASLGSGLLIIALVMPQYLRKVPLNLSQADLKGQNLSYLDLTEAMLWNANLQGANLIGANLNGAYLQRSNLSGVSASLTQLRGADLSYANFTNADLTKADLCATDSVGARFDGATLADVHWEYANLTGSSFSETDMVGVSSTSSACLKESEVVAGQKCCGTRCLKRCLNKH
jgi:hypothetical protein